jgi:hypothetical protein
MMGVLPDERMAFAGNGICPNDASVLKRVTAVLVEQHDEWEVAERRYLSEESMALRSTRRSSTTRGCPWRSRPERMIGVESTSTRPIYTSWRDVILAFNERVRGLSPEAPTTSGLSIDKETGMLARMSLIDRLTSDRAGQGAWLGRDVNKCRVQARWIQRGSRLRT